MDANIAIAQAKGLRRVAADLDRAWDDFLNGTRTPDKELDRVFWREEIAAWKAVSQDHPAVLAAGRGPKDVLQDDRPIARADRTTKILIWFRRMLDQSGDSHRTAHAAAVRRQARPIRLVLSNHDTSPGAIMGDRAYEGQEHAYWLWTTGRLALSCHHRSLLTQWRDPRRVMYRPAFSK